MSEFYSFPENFLWGASTAAVQVEGNTTNSQWNRYLDLNAEKLAEKGEKREGLYGIIEPDPQRDWIKEEAAKTRNYRLGEAVDHINRYPEDFDLLEQLNLNSYRFSIEWSRIQPEEGVFNQEAIENYREILEELKSRNITTIVTLWHFSNPIWFQDQYSWVSDKSTELFVEFARKMAEELGDLVDYWLTVNEPQVYAGNAYLAGGWPPQKKNPVSYFRTIQNMIKAHNRAYEKIKEVDPNSKIGLATNNGHVEATKLLWPFTKVFDYWANHYFLKKTEPKLDFIGLNHYFSESFNPGFMKKDVRRSDLGWRLEPESIYHALKELEGYELPVIITEHGLADRDDLNRKWFIQESLKKVHQAIKEGVDVRGYMHSSLIDNVEWDHGRYPRFGLIEVDYENDLERRLRDSAKEYARIADQNGINTG